MSESLTELLATDAELDRIAARRAGDSDDLVLTQLAILATAVDTIALPPPVIPAEPASMTSIRKGGWALAVTVALMLAGSGVARAVSHDPLAPLHYLTKQVWKLGPHDDAKLPGWELNGAMPISTVPGGGSPDEARVGPEARSRTPGLAGQGVGPDGQPMRTAPTTGGNRRPESGPGTGTGSGERPPSPGPGGGAGSGRPPVDGVGPGPGRAGGAPVGGSPVPGEPALPSRPGLPDRPGPRLGDQDQSAGHHDIPGYGRLPGAATGHGRCRVDYPVAPAGSLWSRGPDRVPTCEAKPSPSPSPPGLPPPAPPAPAPTSPVQTSPVPAPFPPAPGPSIP